MLAESFERIHRSNLIGMGILPLELLPGENADTLGLTGEEPLTITGLATLLTKITVRAGRLRFEVTVRLDTMREAAYYRHGGIMKCVLRDVLDSQDDRESGHAETGTRAPRHE